jgi:hypothetical protein
MKAHCKTIPAWIASITLLIAYFSFFALFNANHLFYQEQIHLFRFDWNYFLSYLERPGGISEYTGNFLMQFYVIPLVGPAILTLAAITVFLVSKYILRQLNISGFIWPLIPVLILSALQCDHIYYVGFTVGFCLLLLFMAIYVSIRHNNIRYITGLAGLPVLYHIAGNFTLTGLLFILIFELLFQDNKRRFAVAATYLVWSLLLLVIIWRYVYLLPVSSEWLNPVFNISNQYTKYWFIFLVLYFPGLLIIIGVILKLTRSEEVVFKWDLKNIVSGLTTVAVFMYCIWNFAFDARSELLLGIDRNVQNSNWERALELSERSSGSNRIAVCLTNMALYNSGQMGDRLFHYNQIGSQGLWLDWGDDASPFFGCELFYQLGYFNEAFHWAFEAFVVKGQSPRTLKMLAKTSLINRDYEVAGKFLRILDQSLFYSKWAKHYLECIADTAKLQTDPEISYRRSQIIKSDFFSDVNHYEYELKNLLENHPKNKMAYMYYISSLLLDKNIEGAAKYIIKMNEYGMETVPVHWEEALLTLGNNSGIINLPDGIKISESTIRRFNDYIDSFSYYGGNPGEAMNGLYKRFGKTYWYYLQFR